MHILHHQKKGPHLNTIERVYIHKESALDNQLNDNQTIFPKKIFDNIIQIQQSQPSTRHIPIPPFPSSSTKR